MERSRASRARALAGIGLAAALLTGCGGDVGDSIVSRLPTALPTLPSLPTSLPTVPSLPTLPSVPTLPPAASPAPPVATSPPVETTTAPAPPAPTTAPAAAPTASPSLPAVAEDELGADDEPVSDAGLGWWWLVLLLLVAAAVALGVLLSRRRARAEWEEQVSGAVEEATWVSDQLIPNLLAQGAYGRAGVWTIGRSRLVDLADRLEDLVADGPDPARARPVAALSSAVQALRAALDQADLLPDFGGVTATAALRQARREIEECVRALRPPDSVS